MSDADPSPPPRWLALGLAALTLIAVAALSLFLFRDDLRRTDDADSGATVTSTPPAGDDFDRPDGRLADADHGWSDVVGAWVVQDGHAALSEGDSGGTLAGLAGLAVLDNEHDDTHLQVTATAVEPGWGVAFRVQEPSNLWAVVADPEQARWSVVHQQDGVPTTVETVAVEPHDGSVIRVDLVGERIEVTVDEVAAEPIDDPALADRHLIGLLALPGGSLASMAWDDLTVSGS
jgi:hypothetical protein